MWKILFEEVKKFKLLKMEKTRGQEQLKLDGLGIHLRNANCETSPKTEKQKGRSRANCVQGCHPVNDLR